MSYKLLASDMDGTLLDNASNVSKENAKAIADMVARGNYFVLTTGRPYQAVTKYVQALGLQNMPIICYNGAVVILNGEEILNLTLPDEYVGEIAGIGHSRNSTMLCWAKGRLFAEKTGEKLDYYVTISDVEPEIIPDLSILKDVTKFVWYDSELETKQNYVELSAKYNGVLNVHPSRIDFLEFVNKRCSKALALEAIALKLGLKREEIIAVGDGYNDLSMLTWAGVGAAVSNAPTDVKKQAKIVAPSNEQNAVKWLIDRYFNENKGY